MEAKDGHAGVCLWSWVLDWGALLGSSGGKLNLVHRALQELSGMEGSQSSVLPYEPQPTSCPTLSPFWHPERRPGIKAKLCQGHQFWMAGPEGLQAPLEGSWSERGLRP